jgi:4-diphosphocytidyl-2-C-methyl-D-erythritol kinase
VRGRAYAKVNLSLEVLHRRDDGYHELLSVFQTVSLHDELSLEAADELRLACDLPELLGDDNLVLRAARLLDRGGHFQLRKGIPIAGGMGGGSSDAALALRLLDGVYRMGLSAEELHTAAAELGSDVPFFLTAGTASVEGRGEHVTPLVDLPAQWLAVLNPRVPLSTPAVFRELRPEEYAEGKATSAWIGAWSAARSARSPSAAVRQRGEPQPAEARNSEALPPSINSLQAPAERLEPRIVAAREALLAAGAERVLLSGSGPTVFGFCRDEAHAREVAGKTGGWPARFVGRAEALALAQD